MAMVASKQHHSKAERRQVTTQTLVVIFIKLRNLPIERAKDAVNGVA